MLSVKSVMAEGGREDYDKFDGNERGKYFKDDEDLACKIIISVSKN